MRPVPSDPVISIRDPGALDLVRFLLQQGVSVRIRVSGCSMQPLLYGGETLEIASVHEEQLRIGDILLLCNRQNAPLVHRLLRRRYTNNAIHLQTKGDACPGFDSFVPAFHLMGRVQCIMGADRTVIDLQCPLIRLKSLLIANRSLMVYYLQRAAVFVKNKFMYLQTLFLKKDNKR